MNKNTILDLLQSIWSHISSRRQKHFILLLILMIISSFTEMISIGAIIPFLGALSSPGILFSNKLLHPIFLLLHINKSEDILFPLTMLFITASIIAGLMRLLLLWLTNKISYITGAELSYKIYNLTLLQHYEVHCSRNSSGIIDVIINKTNTVIATIIMVFTIINAAVMLFSILAVLLIINPTVSLIIFFGFSIIYITINRLTRNQLYKNSDILAYESTNLIKLLNEGLGGIRDIILDGTYNFYCKIYKSADLNLRKSQGSNLFIAQSPKYIIEALGVVFITLVAYSISKNNDGITNSIPFLGAMALGIQRLLPILQQAYGAWSGIQGSRNSLINTLELLNQDIPIRLSTSNIEKIEFYDKIELKDVSFKYLNSNSLVLKKINLTINKGNRIGLIGKTGSGKSTLIDIIMGLLSPTEGNLLVDSCIMNSENKHLWQEQISHVPQFIFLSDKTIRENIAFGIENENIDLNRVYEAARKAQLEDTILNLPLKYDTIIGERGIKLSGGQRQRIGIARALYKKAKVIILDEATSALDNETEDDVMNSVEELSTDLTIIIIAHRLNTLKKCTKIYNVANNELNEVANIDLFNN